MNVIVLLCMAAVLIVVLFAFAAAMQAQSRRCVQQYIREQRNIDRFRRRGGRYHMLSEAERCMVRNGQFPPPERGEG